MKELEKWQVQSGISDFPFTPEAGHEILFWDIGRGKKHTYLWRWRDAERNSNKQDLVSFFQFITLTSYLFILLRFFHNFSLLIKQYKKAWV